MAVLLLSLLVSAPAYSEASSSSSSSAASATPTPTPILITYRSSSLSSRLALDGARLRLATENPSSVTVQEKDLDQSGSALADVRRTLSDSSTRLLVALEPSLDPAFPPLIDSLRLTVVSSAFLEGVISPGIQGLFSVYPRTTGVRDAIERFFVAQPEVKKFGIVCSNSRIGVRYSEIWSEIAEARGLGASAPTCGNEKSFDFRVFMLRAKGQQIDGFGVGFGSLNVISRLRDLTWPRPLLLSAPEGEELLFDTTQDRAFLPEIFFDSPVFSELFANGFIQRYPGRVPTLSAALGYEAANALLKAAAIPGDTVAAMRKVSYSGVSGPVDFRLENTGNGAKSVLMRVEGDRAVRMN
jgi:hypothetical protein